MPFKGYFKGYLKCNHCIVRDYNNYNNYGLIDMSPLIKKPTKNIFEKKYLKYKNKYLIYKN